MSNNRLKKDIAINHLSEEQITRYNEGKMKPSEMHLVERHLLDCEFCSDAVEGSGLIKSEDSSSIIEDLKEEISKRAGTERDSIYWRIGIAASILLIIGFGLIFFLNKSADTKSNSVAFELPRAKEKISTPAPQGNAESRREEKKEAEESDKNTFADDETAVKSEAQTPGDSNYKTDQIIASSEGFTGNQVFKGPVIQESKASEPSGNMSKVLSGKVTDPTGEPLAGISVVVKGSDIGTITNVNGEYSLITPVKTDSLIFNSIGFKTLGVAVNTKDQKVNARLSYDIAMMDTISSGRNGYAAARETESPMSGPTTEIKTAKPQLFNEGGSLQVSGRVMAEDGIPLPGVSVVVKGTSSGALTDRDGNYSLSVPDSKANLVFSHIGYSTEELAINAADKKADVVLNEDNQKLSEVVVIDSKRAKAERTKKGEITPPSPENGFKKYQKYLSEHIKIPSAGANSDKKEVVLSILISEAGAIEQIKVKESLGKVFDDEAIRLIKEGPAWKAGTIDGVATKQSVIVRVSFKK
jgi:hypothetical protein